MKIFVKGHLFPNKKFILFLISILILKIPVSAASQDKPPKLYSKRSLELSLLFPGAGQIKEHKYLEGIFFAASELFCIINAVSNNRRGDKNYKQYKSASSEEYAVFYRKEVEKYDKTRNIYIFAGLGIWIINMIDIHIHVKKKKIKLALKYEKNHNISFSLSYGF